MSAKSRAREQERSEAALEARYGPFPDPGTIPPPLEEQDPELARRMAWFCTHRREIAEALNVKKIIIDDGAKSFLVVRKPEPPDLAMLNATALVAAFGGMGW